MGGRLDVQSRVASGTRFVLQLFLPEVREPRVLITHQRDIVGYAGPRRAVLVADDLADQRRIVTSVLEPLGFAMLEASSGPQALQLLATHEVDLIVMDVAMPSMDGFEASQLIRQHRLTEAPILILSANAFAGDLEKGAAAGCEDYLAKPIHLPLLLDKVATLLGLEWLTDAAGREEPAAASTRPALPLPEPLALELRRYLELGYMEGFVEQLEEALRADPDLADTLAPLRESARRFMLDDLDRQLRAATGATRDAA
jgi:CheY-like chemotaxis protein